MLKKSLNENPDILFDVIKNNPTKFFESVRQASEDMRKKDLKDRQTKMDAQMEEQMKNPLKPDLSGRAFFGNKDAPITIVEYSDYQCPFCKEGSKRISRVLNEYKDKVRVLYKHYIIKPMGRLSAQYYEALAMQSASKAKEFHDKVFQDQRSLSTGKEKFLKKVLAEIQGVNTKKFERDLNSKAVQDIIDKDIEEAKSFRVTGTPSFVINGVLLVGAVPYGEMKKIIDKHLSQLNDKKGKDKQS